jgi:S-adenosylmethionine:tRNA ribosyltransferase-isomerase
MTLGRFDARELDYELPDDRIAQAPPAERDAARLLCLARDGAIAHHGVRELPELLRPSLIVVNDTRVIPARLFGHKPSGGKVELLLCERLSPAGARERWLALGKASKGLRPGDRVALDSSGAPGAAMIAQVIALHERAIEVELSAEPDVSTALARIGQIPLPPYIRRAPDAIDAERYQTIFAAHDGAVAAPTAGLHLSPALLAALRARGHELAFVTLHVGPGTFAPLRSDDLAEHVMHPERYAVPDATATAIAHARASGRQVLAVGTTVVRALEAAARDDGSVQAGSGATALFIYPPYRFRVVDAVMTNFHLPRSTLLALVMAFGGIEPVRHAYRIAVESGYRFYSYGDAMLIGGTA